MNLIKFIRIFISVSTLSDQSPNPLQFSNSNTNNNGNIGTSAVLPSSTTSSVHHKKLSGQGAIQRRKEPRRHTLQNGIDYNMVIFVLIMIVV